jgi:pilus assembly protein CpaF
MAGFDLPVSVIRKQIASAVDLIVQQARSRDGSRRITQITEVQGMEGDTVVLQDIFLYKAAQVHGEERNSNGGQLEAVGIRPRFTSRLEENGFKLGGEVFARGRNGAARR